MKIELSKAEVQCLILMASEVAEHGDVLEQTFPNARRRATAERAYEKLQAALRHKRGHDIHGGR